MPKFSIIIPVYNVEKYIGKCLNSIMNQTYKDYEVIIVNDGTKDHSMEIVKDYDVKVINQKNQGLSAARNRGVKEATGDYILFIDSDDYIEKDLLKELNKSLKNNPDLVRFQVQEVYDNGKIMKYEETPFEDKSGEEAFSLITSYHFVENAWCYLYKTSYYKENNYEFKKGTIHEDFGLIPIVIMKAKRVNAISYIGYNYFQRENGIMGDTNYEKTKKKVADMFIHYQFLEEEIKKTKLDSKIFKSYISNSLVLKICELKGKEYQEAKRKLLELKVYDNILNNTISRKIKKMLMQWSPKLAKRLLRQ